MFKDTIYQSCFGPGNPKAPLNKLVMGAEFEMEAANHYPTVEMLMNQKINFTRHEDGSLRNRGTEFVTQTPVPPATLITDYAALLEEIKRTHTKLIKDSPRISTHIHINCLPLSIKQTTNFVATCYILEDFFILLAGDKRIANQFCLSIKEAENQLYNFDNLYRQRFNDMGREDAFKYSNINLCSLVSKGTVEIRSLEGNPSLELFGDWVRMFEEIYNYSTRPDFNIHNDLLQAISNQRPYQWLRANLPITYNLVVNIQWKLTPHEIDEAIYSNLRLIQPQLYQFSTLVEKEELALQKGEKIQTGKKSFAQHPENLGVNPMDADWDNLTPAERDIVIRDEMGRVLQRVQREQRQQEQRNPAGEVNWNVPPPEWVRRDGPQFRRLDLGEWVIQNAPRNDEDGA